jgi:hypothetical protein
METCGDSVVILTKSWHFEECWQGLVEHWMSVSHKRPVKCGGHSQLSPMQVPPFLHGVAMHQSSSAARSQCIPIKHHAPTELLYHAHTYHCAVTNISINPFAL